MQLGDERRAHRDSDSKPRVSIGMPVYNGEKYLRESLDSILSQTYQDLELIISDNASTDNTKKICLEYAERDNRVSYYCNKKNVGAPSNYNRVFEFSSGEYFKWAAYDDVLAPEFLSKCIKVLDSDPAIILCHSKTGRIDREGNLLDYYNQGMLRRIDSPKPHERFRDLIGMYYTTCPIFGVIRAKLFSQTMLHGDYIGADRNLLAEIGLMGRIYQIPECLFFWRDHPDSYSSIFYMNDRIDTLDQLRKESEWWSDKNWTYFPHWKNCFQYFKAINRVKLNWPERLFCYSEIFRWFMDEGIHFMAKDLKLFLLNNSSLARKLVSCFPWGIKRTIFKKIRDEEVK
jgi:glycosyltransferase involved in cell wall biosynthesis